jgi:MoaA/NifB/PqqE/SkfB family radical SAM enzyme
MEIILENKKPVSKPIHFKNPVPAPSNISGNNRAGSWERQLIWWAIKSRIFYLACITIRNPKKIWKVYKHMLQLRSDIYGGDLRKIYRIGNKYHFTMYTPGWPSKGYDTLIKNELRRHAFPLDGTEKMSFAFLAITRKCPMRCEHCFEWDNLNQKESFTRDELLTTIDMYMKEGVLQFHLSGGEPMVRFRDLVAIIEQTSRHSECWVLSSGFNVTPGNAQKLKAAGCRGMVISIDHYIPELHNMFRGNMSAFDAATNAVTNAKAAGLVTAISVCATKDFLEKNHITAYMDFARNLGVQFVQVLEPRSVGHYEGKDVTLKEIHIQFLEKIFKTYNHHPLYKTYPTMMYHGYHQRRVGCFSGSRSVYIDSAGDVHACPFCHTKSFNVIDLIRSGKTELPKKVNACPQFNKIA